MHLNGEIYRPPTEQHTPLLQVTTGCSHNTCTFCAMYRTCEFCVSPIQEIEEDLDELLYKHGSDLTRIFLLNGNPFTLGPNRLLGIAKLIRNRFPAMRTISCYATVQDILAKNQEQLIALAEAGYGHIYIGLETSYPPALKMMGKGCTAQQQEEALGKMQVAGLTYTLSLMTGIAGKGNSQANVAATTRVINGYPPVGIGCMPTLVVPQSPLAALRDRGDFVELSEAEHVEEEILFLESLDVPAECFFYGSHSYTLLPVSGPMHERDAMIEQLKQGLSELDSNVSNATVQRFWPVHQPRY